MILPLDIIQVFQDKWPEFTFVVVLIVVVGFVVWKISAFYHTRIKSLEDKVKHAECQRHGSAINSFDASTQAILHKIEFIERALIAKDPTMLTTFAKSNSPLQLNQNAVKLMSDSRADIILDEHKDDLITKIQELRPATAYDVEQHAYRVLIMSSDEQWFIPLKDYIFNHPIFQGQSINVDVICFIMSLPLRNYYLETHPEIEQ